MDHGVVFVVAEDDADRFVFARFGAVLFGVGEVETHLPGVGVRELANLRSPSGDFADGFGNFLPASDSPDGVWQIAWAAKFADGDCNISVRSVIPDGVWNNSCRARAMNSADGVCRISQPR